MLPKIPKHAESYLEYIGRLGYKPKGKEVKFLKDVKIYVERDMMLTDPMAQFLIDIYERASGGGQYQNKERRHDL